MYMKDLSLYVLPLKTNTGTKRKLTTLTIMPGFVDVGDVNYQLAEFET